MVFRQGGKNQVLTEQDYDDYLESQRKACILHGEDVKKAIKKVGHSWVGANVRPSSWVIRLYVMEGDSMRGSAMSDFTD